MTVVKYLYKQQGFTLLELVIGLFIVAIVASLAVPSMSNMITRNRLSAEYNRFIGDLALARSEAVTRGVPVSLCPSTNQSSCSGNNWDQGWIVFVDDGDGTSSNAGNRDRDGAEEIIRVSAPTKGGVDIRSVNFTDDGGVLFSGDGRIEAGTPADIGVFIVCNEYGASKARGVEFSPFGQLRNMRDSDSNGTVDYTHGGSTVAVTCP